MKAIYYTVTFLAAVVILTVAGWVAYTHHTAIKTEINHLTNPACKCAPCNCNTPCHCGTKK